MEREFYAGKIVAGEITTVFREGEIFRGEENV